MIGAIVLAAGHSRRMGVQKLLLPYGDTTIIAHIVDQVLASAVDPVVVVVRADPPTVILALGDRPVNFAVNPSMDGDMLSSVRVGLRALPGSCRGVLFVLGDQPSVTPALIERLIATFAADASGIVVPVFEGRRGHPLLVAGRFIQEILTSYEREGLRGLLRAHPEAVHELSSPESSVVEDMDEPEDYERERRRLNPS